ncbi:MAG: hypothetical protein PHR21_05460 [Oscillospiraceae bacterium]|nr:hypothetical protein [Oscillospiraceae bacterium]MDD4368634.1 hypothetical protein [Oscillospiraceae bacterium]
MISRNLKQLASDLQWHKAEDSIYGCAQHIPCTIVEQSKSIAVVFYLPHIQEITKEALDSYFTRHASRFKITNLEFSDDFYFFRIKQNLIPLAKDKIMDLLLIASNLIQENQPESVAFCAACGQPTEPDELGLYLGFYCAVHEHCPALPDAAGNVRPADLQINMDGEDIIPTDDLETENLRQ